MARTTSERGADLTPLIFAPPPPAVPPTRAVPQLVATITAGGTDQLIEVATTSTGIDYDSVTVPDAAPHGTFADPLDGPEPFDD
jgi:hypothetical protein